MKKTINIVITDLDDLHKVLESVDKFLRAIMIHYIETDMTKLYKFVVSLSVWFGQLLHYLGVKPEDFKDG